jgi:hypothetical protein
MGRFLQDSAARNAGRRSLAERPLPGGYSLADALVETLPCESCTSARGSEPTAWISEMPMLPTTAAPPASGEARARILRPTRSGFLRMEDRARRLVGAGRTVPVPSR